MARKMKDSGIEWIGEIPEDWEVIKVKHEYRFLTGFTPETNRSEYYDDEDGYEWVNISDLDGCKFLNKQTKNKISKIYIDLYKPKAVPQDSLMYSFKLSVGQRAFNVRESYTNEAIASFIKNKNIDLNYFYYSSSLIEYNSNKNIYGARILNQELIKNAPIPFPSLEEQYKISSFLDNKVEQIEEIENTINKEIENLEKYKKSLITEAVTKGLDKNVPMKDSSIDWIGEIPKDWSLNKIKNCADIFGRIGYRGYTQNDIVNEGEGAVSLSPSNMVNGEVLYNNNTFITWEKYNESPEIKVKIGDIIMVKTGSSYGKVSILKNLVYKSTINPQLVVLKTKHIIKSYLFYFMNSNYFDYQVEMSVTGGTIPTMSQEKIKNFHLPTPKIDEQKAIVSYLDKRCELINETISLKQKQLQTLEEYKKSLIYEYVTGKKEV